MCLDSDGVYNLADFPDYFINRSGEFFSKKSGKLKPIKTRLSGNGYQMVYFYKNNKGYNKYVHRLLYETFVSRIPEGYHIDHIDGDRENNSLENLEPVTPHINNSRKARMRKHKYIREHPQKKGYYSARFFVYGTGLIHVKSSTNYNYLVNELRKAYYSWYGQEPNILQQDEL